MGAVWIIDENKFKEYKAEFHKKRCKRKAFTWIKVAIVAKSKGDAKINELLNQPNEYETF